jgi:hypothetical protein
MQKWKKGKRQITDDKFYQREIFCGPKMGFYKEMEEKQNSAKDN